MEADIVGFQEVSHTSSLQEALGKSGLCEGATVLTSGETGDRLHAHPQRPL
jgi:hypothetical protein